MNTNVTPASSILRGRLGYAAFGLGLAIVFAVLGAVLLHQAPAVDPGTSSFTDGLEAILIRIAGISGFVAAGVAVLFSLTDITTALHRARRARQQIDAPGADQ